VNLFALRPVLLLSLFLLQAPIVVAAEVRVASVQFDSLDGEFDKNLAQVAKYVRRASAQGADITLLPEFALIGYNLSAEIWSSAEPAHGPTLRALSTLAIDTQMYIGTSFLEVKGDRFFNTFLLVGPNGSVAGTVRKQVPAGAEGYFFEGHTNHHVIDTPLGKIGVGICQETYRCFLPQQLHEGDADFVLMPFSYPDLARAGGLASPKGRYIAQWYANQLGVPVVTSNKTGPWPQVGGAFFPGYSAAVGSDGQILTELADEPGILVANLTLNRSSKSTPTADCIGPFLRELTLGSWLQKRITWASIWLAELFDANPDDQIHSAYLASEKRRAAAAKFSEGAMNSQ